MNETAIRVSRPAETPAPAGNMKIAVLVPCYNEGQTIADVVIGFRAALPNAAIYVYDNNSRDETASIAANAGAIVRCEPLQGKGNVVRRMFADIDADIYVLVDGDATYDAAAARNLVACLVNHNLDMVVGMRVGAEGFSYRPGHRFGNQLFSGLVGRIFGSQVTDILSGYRILSRRFVKSFPALSSGFEIETELTVHALELRMPILEEPTQYSTRPSGSHSKLSTWRDGLRILAVIVLLVKDERPLAFFSAIFGVLAGLAIFLAWPLVTTFLEIGLVPRLPTAVLATGIMLLAFLSLTAGIILDTVTQGRREFKRLAYLQVPAVNADPPSTPP